MAQVLTKEDRLKRQERIGEAARIVEREAHEPFVKPQAKCPICRVRVAFVKNGRDDRTCGECAQLHFQTVTVTLDDGTVTHHHYYVSLETLLKEGRERARRRDHARVRS